MANNPTRVNPIGQIADGVVEQLKSTGSQAAAQVASEPAKILEQILGGGVATDQPASGEQQLEQGAANPSANAGQAQQQELLKMKQQEAQQRDQALYKLHQQRLQEEVSYHEKRKHEEQQEELIEEKQEEQKKQQIVQLKRERDDEVWQQQIKAVQGSHEGQQGKM
jgi:hypothetical protein